jgi:hypothetical protein
MLDRLEIAPLGEKVETEEQLEDGIMATGVDTFADNANLVRIPIPQHPPRQRLEGVVDRRLRISAMRAPISSLLKVATARRFPLATRLIQC